MTSSLPNSEASGVQGRAEPAGTLPRLLLAHVTTVAVAMLAGVLGALLYARSQPAPVRIQVLEMRRLVDQVARDPTLDEAERLARTRELGELASQYVSSQAAKGVIVLDGSVVLRAPAWAYVEPWHD